MDVNVIFSVCKVKSAPSAYAFGYDGDLVVRNKTDMGHFKNLTTGHTLIMGRKTFESLDSKSLPNRKTIVVTSQAIAELPKIEMVQYARSLADAIKIAESDGDEKAFVIGGAELIREAMIGAQNIYYTVFNYSIDHDLVDTYMNMNLLLGTKFFSMVERNEFRETCTIVPLKEEKVLRFKMYRVIKSEELKKTIAENSALKKKKKEEREQKKAMRKLAKLDQQMGRYEETDNPMIRD